MSQRKPAFKTPFAPIMLLASLELHKSYSVLPDDHGATDGDIRG